MVFSILYGLDQVPTTNATPSIAAQYSTQELIQAINTSTNKQGMVSAPAILNNLESTIKTVKTGTQNQQCLNKLVKAVMECEKEGNLSAGNFSAKWAEL